jgi:hypothetical protein
MKLIEFLNNHKKEMRKPEDFLMFFAEEPSRREIFCVKRFYWDKDDEKWSAFDYWTFENKELVFHNGFLNLNDKDTILEKETISWILRK